MARILDRVLSNFNPRLIEVVAQGSGSGDALSDIDRDLLAWQQGDVGRPGVFLSVASSKVPLAPNSLSLSTDEAEEFFMVEEEVEAVVVLTQTCDLVRSVSTTSAVGGRLWVQVAPLVRLTGTDLDNATRGRIPRFAPVPGEGDDAFADLDRCTTLEKSVLVRLEHSRGCPDHDSVTRFSNACARNRGRFAFPDELSPALDPLRREMQKRSGRATALGRRVDDVLQIRVEPMPGWAAETISVTVHFIVSSTSLPALDEWEVVDRVRHADIATLGSAAEVAEAIEACSQEAPAERDAGWQRLAQLWVASCVPNQKITAISGVASSASDFTMEQMRNAPQLDLDHLSTVPSTDGGADPTG